MYSAPCQRLRRDALRSGQWMVTTRGISLLVYFGRGTGLRFPGVASTRSTFLAPWSRMCLKKLDRFKIKYELQRIAEIYKRGCGMVAVHSGEKLIVQMKRNSMRYKYSSGPRSERYELVICASMTSPKTSQFRYTYPAIAALCVLCLSCSSLCHCPAPEHSG